MYRNSYRLGLDALGPLAGASSNLNSVLVLEHYEEPGYRKWKAHHGRMAPTSTLGRRWVNGSVEMIR